MSTIHKYNILKRYLIITILILSIKSVFPSKEAIISIEQEDNLELVQDYTHFLTIKQDKKLNKKLVLIDEKYSIKIYFVVTDSVLNLSTKKIINARIAQTKNSKWILILLSQNFINQQNKVSIRFSENLHPIITDELTHRIIRHEIYSNFDKGKYYRGIDAAVNVFNSIISNKFSAKKYLTRNKNKEDTEDKECSNWLLILITLFAFIFLIYKIIRKRNKL